MFALAAMLTYCRQNDVSFAVLPLALGDEFQETEIDEILDELST